MVALDETVKVFLESKAEYGVANTNPKSIAYRFNTTDAKARTVLKRLGASCEGRNRWKYITDERCDELNRKLARRKEIAEAIGFDHYLDVPRDIETIELIIAATKEGKL